jgi:drug/metabolite transporter (DMT)-like permease
VITTPRPGLGILMILAGSTLFAANGTVSKLVLQSGLDPLQLTTIRATGAVLGLFLLTLVVDRRRLRLTRRELPLLLAYGLAGFFLVPVLYFVAISRLPVGIGLLFEYTAPLLVALWARFVQRRTVKPRLWVGLALSLIGLACVAEIWGDLRLDRLGIAAGLVSAAMLAAYYLLGARGVAERDTLSLTGWAFAVSAVAGAVVRPWWNFDTGSLTVQSRGLPVWLLLIYVIVLGSIVPYLLIAGSLRHLPATSVGIIGMVEPILAATVAWLALEEHLNVAQLAGGALVLAGVALAETARTGGPADAPPPG